MSHADSPWVQGGDIHGNKHETFTRGMNGHWLAAQRAPQGSRMWWAFIDGSPIGGRHKTAEKAMKKCERMANASSTRTSKE